MNLIIEEISCLYTQMKKYWQNTLKKWYYRILKRINYNIKGFQ